MADKTNYFIIAIIAIVAIVGMVVLFMYVSEPKAVDHYPQGEMALAGQGYTYSGVVPKLLGGDIHDTIEEGENREYGDRDVPGTLPYRPTDEAMRQYSKEAYSKKYPGALVEESDRRLKDLDKAEELHYSLTYSGSAKDYQYD